MKLIPIKSLIINKKHKEWGTWIVDKLYDEGIYEIRGDRGCRILMIEEFEKFWEIVKGNKL